MSAIKDQSVISVAEIDTNTDARDITTRAVNAAVEVFTIDEGHACVPNDRCPLEALFSALSKISATFNLTVDPEVDLNSRETLHRILQAIFDTDTQGFLEQETSEIFAHLSSTQKDRILAQAIATTTIIFQRLAETGRPITKGLLNREAQLFAESDQRTLMQDSIEESTVFARCDHKSELTKAITDAMEAEESPSTPQPLVADDKEDFMFSPNAGHERPKNMGLPFGFTIMSIN
ncbi:hypothetical protein BGZ61DRAFT_495936 [Ilyonectria robusta]|uniref:uncharacterized protein n=1 Tax=Ilyonectria robusta TaxID=1079257 RepID=UPI001E8E7A77|nr:uncharacterized protein BGZ61DRAFT_495936 [Ilyonectria robusta]KAH8683550.1 hypothetical protein BGZ61DRAFT_495936 [Ilyonectria robusta]